MLSFSASSRLVPAHDDMCLVGSDSLRGRSFHAMLRYEGPASLVKLFSHIPPFLASCTIFDHLFGIRLGACYILVLSMYPPGLVENESYELP